MFPEVIIVGAGPGGLASALLAARDGARVTVYERAGHVGGRCSLMRAEGFTFDTGPTFFFMPDELRRLVADCGGDLDEEIELLALDPLYTVVFGSGRRIDVRAEPDATRRALALHDPREAAAFEAYCGDARRNYAAVEPLLDHGFDDPRGMIPALLRALPTLRPWRSLYAEMARRFRDPELRDLFTVQSAYIGMSPRRCPSLFSFVPFVEAHHGLVHPRGGCGAVMEVLAELARRRGVEIRLSEPVTRILVEGGRAVGVAAGGREHRADAVVLNADFAHGMRTLLPAESRRRWTDARIAGRQYSCSTYMLYLGLEGRVDALSHHTLVLPHALGQDWAAIDGAWQARERGFYVQNACVTDPSLAPAGMSTLFVMVTVPNRGIDVEHDLPALRRHVLRRLEALGVEGIEHRIRFEAARTPRDWEAQGIYRGAVFNMAHSLRQLGYLRPHARSEDVAHLYVVGGGAHPGSGLPLIFKSARIAHRSLARDLGLAAPARAGRACA